MFMFMCLFSLPRLLAPSLIDLGVTPGVLALGQTVGISSAERKIKRCPLPSQSLKLLMLRSSQGFQKPLGYVHNKQAPEIASRGGNAQQHQLGT